MIAQFGLECELYSTTEGDEDLEICVGFLQGNITQCTFIGMFNQLSVSITSSKSS